MSSRREQGKFPADGIGMGKDSAKQALNGVSSGNKAIQVKTSIEKLLRDKFRFTDEILSCVRRIYEMERTGSPSTSHLGSMPSPGDVDAARHPPWRLGAPSAILFVT